MTDARGGGRGGGGSGGAMRDALRSFAPALPPLAAGAFLVASNEPPGHAWAWLGGSLALSALLVVWARAGIARRLSTVASVLSSFREGDFSIRARAGVGDGALSEVLSELNGLGDTLREHRLGEMEAWTLLRKVMAEVDVVVLAFDERGRMKLANDAASRLFGAAGAALLGKTATELGVQDLLSGEAPRVVRDSEPLGAGPWELRRGAFRLSGEPHTLVVLSDVSSALREQERDAWKRLIRVMGHEINNSLAPIRSISDNLESIFGKTPRPEGWEEDVTGGLSIIARRAEALSRFMAAYAELARLPPPKMGEVDVAAWVKRAAALEQRLAVRVDGGPDAVIAGDADQLDQLLINLVKNAAEASLEVGAKTVAIGWEVSGTRLRLVVEDEGPGVAQATNLFVPFFTTKQGGSGIGLALARQIAEGHRGRLALETRAEGKGAAAVLELPLGPR